MAKKKASTRKTTPKASSSRARAAGVKKMQREDATRTRKSKAVKKGASYRPSAPPPRDRTYL